MRVRRSTSRRTGVAGLLVLATLAALAPLSVPARAATRPGRAFDFNGDGYRDLVVGAPEDDVGGARDAGAINVLYGSRRGITAAGDDFFSQGSAGVAETPGTNDLFGRSFASGDFDRDGFADLAVGAPGETVAGHAMAGAVHVLYGSSGGLTAAGSQLWRQGPALGSAPRERESFGAALAVADWDRNGFADLAVGSPREDVNGIKDAGAVQIIEGSASGLRAAGATVWTQDTPGVADAAEYRWAPETEPAPGDYDFPEWFGAALAAGDINGDGYPELVIGVPGETVRPADETACTGATCPVKPDAYGAGAVHVLFGRRGGLTAEGDEFWHQNSRGVSGTAVGRRCCDGEPGAGEGFGSALAIADFNGDGYGDTAVGAPLDPIDQFCATGDGGQSCAQGAVNVLYGGPSGIRLAGDELLHLSAPGVAGTASDRSTFGSSLSAADATGDRFAELAIGIPALPAGRGVYAGGVLVLRGAGSGLVTDGDRLWTQDKPSVLGESEHGDRFGGSVALRQFGGSARADLAIGIDGENASGNADAGRVSILYGSRTGPTAEHDQLWSRTSEGVRGAAGAGDRFGFVGTYQAVPWLYCSQFASRIDNCDFTYPFRN